jgi:NAD(P)-dependent dehydrogenase (short-subunit alcohol dehydrogenase family)
MRSRRSARTAASERGVRGVVRVLVTGSSRGIGHELVRQYADAGHDVVATCRDPDRAADLAALAAAHEGVEIRQLDVTDDHSIDALAQALDGRGIDVLFNNAGFYGRAPGPLEGVDPDDWLQMFRVNTIGPLAVTRALLPALRLGSDAKVVGLSSVKASITRNRLGGSYQYRSTKAGLNAILRSLAVDLRPEGIAVYALSPGWVVRGENYGAGLSFDDRLRKARRLLAEFGEGGARQSLPQAVERLIATVGALGLDDSGGFFDHLGRPMEW